MILHAAGTDPTYRGLWRDVAAYVPPAEDEALPTLVSMAPVPTLAEAMAQLDRVFDRIAHRRHRGTGGLPKVVLNYLQPRMLVSSRKVSMKWFAS